MTDPAQAVLESWRADPVLFVRELFGVEPDEWQADVLRGFPKQTPDWMRVSLQSCSGTGKTTVLAWCAWNFMLCYGEKGEHPQGAVVSITKENLRDYIWKELAKWRTRTPILDETFGQNEDRIFNKTQRETWFLSARSFPKDADQDTLGRTLSGLHGKYVLFLIDEAGAIPPAIGRSAEQAQDLGQAFYKVMAAGNPLSTDGLLYEIATNLRHLWHIVCVTGDPDDPKRSPRKPIEVARQAIATYGRDNAWVRIYTLGQFPLTALNKFLSPDDIAAAMKRTYRQSEIAWSQNRLGIDPARFGDDRTGFVRRQGLVMWPSEHMRGATSSEIAARAAVLHGTKDVGPFDLVLVDAGGPNSGGAVDQMRAAGLPVIEVHSSGKAPDPEFYNNRAYMEWHAAEWVKRAGAFPNDQAMAREAVAASYDFKNGKLIVESKDDIKLRLGESPDLWDPAKLTFAIPDAPKGIGLPADHTLATMARQPQLAMTEYRMFDQ